MAAGGPGAPSPLAAKPVEEAPGHGQGNATIQQTEKPNVQGNLLKLKPATQKNAHTHTTASLW